MDMKYRIKKLFVLVVFPVLAVVASLMALNMFGHSLTTNEAHTTVSAKGQSSDIAIGAEPSEVVHVNNTEETPYLFHRKAMIEGKEINLVGSRVDPKKSKLKIISPKVIKNNGADQTYTGYSLKEYAVLGKYKAVHSGGYLSSWSPALPLGYLKIDDDILNKAHHTYATNGFICINDKDVIISSFKDVQQFQGWSDCLQTGTMLIEDGSIVIDQSRKGWYITGDPKLQAFICQKTDGDILIGTSQENISLTSLTDYMAKPESNGGLGCHNAISRSSGHTAGMIINEDNSYTEFGNVGIPLPDAIVVE